MTDDIQNLFMQNRAWVELLLRMPFLLEGKAAAGKNDPCAANGPEHCK